MAFEKTENQATGGTVVYWRLADRRTRYALDGTIETFLRFDGYITKDDRDAKNDRASSREVFVAKEVADSAAGYTEAKATDTDFFFDAKDV